MRLAASALATLSVDERERADRFHRHHDAICFAGMRAASHFGCPVRRKWWLQVLTLPYLSRN
jgi:hypothetical protein